MRAPRGTHTGCSASRTAGAATRPSSGFDCSGLVRHVFGRFGLELPHSSYADFELGKGVARGSLRPGDLVFFNGLGHVGLYVGSGRFIHAPHSGTTVRITSMNDPWYRSRFDGARRVVHAIRQRAPSAG